MIENDHLKMAEIFKSQKEAFLHDSYPSYQNRYDLIKQLKKKLLASKSELLHALNEDFGYRDDNESAFIELVPLFSSFNYILKNLKAWMKKEKRHTHWLFWPSKNYVFYQPKGVVGILSPWNYPLLLSIIPIIYALAAGNRLMVKLSELTPKTEEILVKIFSSVCLENEVIFISGGAEVAAKFTQLDFDHILFTGSTSVGRKVMQAASENLTPVTLELGGKCPVIITENINLKETVKNILYAKYVNAGQTCIAPDYIYCPESMHLSLLDELEIAWQSFTKNSSDKLTSIIDGSKVKRFKSLLEDARTHGASVKILGQDNDIWTEAQLLSHQLPLAIVYQLNDQMRILNEEIFGPVLPVITYQSLDEVIEQIKHKPKALSLYFYGEKVLFEKVIRNVHSGGACLNAALVQVAQDDLPFGGVGLSGMGSYHAKEGFITFSHPKAIYQKRGFNTTRLAYPPYKKLQQLLLKFLIR
ncbi:aldehyde dehydrogenase family protein [Thiotrichales bacterium 19S11-10]|nr:aldehyde dehydrogenase family protein [Thiotrichales bacterium 19S11-10]